jgi:hypothetical protein
MASGEAKGACIGISIAVLLSLYCACVGITEAVALSRASDFKDGCYYIWIMIIILCVLNLMSAIAIPCATLAVMLSNEKSKSDSSGIFAVIGLGVRIWLVVVWFDLDNGTSESIACMNTYINDYPLLWSMFNVEFVWFWINIGLIVLMCCCGCGALCVAGAKEASKPNQETGSSPV